MARRCWGAVSVLERCVSVAEASGAVFELSKGDEPIGEAMAHVKAA